MYWIKAIMDLFNFSICDEAVKKFEFVVILNNFVINVLKEFDNQMWN